jgi:hypothetical protein
MIGAENWGLVALGGVASLIASILYMIGGTTMSFGGQKWLRRYVASALLAGAANGIAAFLQVWTWQYLLMWPCLIGGFSLGYSSDTTIGKAIKRLIFALGVLSACMIGVWAVGFTGAAWVVLGLAAVIGAGSVVLGVWNPFNNAPLEQFIICQILTMFVPFWAFIR